MAVKPFARSVGMPGTRRRRANAWNDRGLESAFFKQLEGALGRMGFGEQFGMRFGHLLGLFVAKVGNTNE